LRVGAAKVDITPAANAALPMAGYAQRKQGFKRRSRSHLVRAIVIDDGASQAALVAWELISVPNQWFRGVWRAKPAYVPAPDASAVPDHGAPTLGGSFGVLTRQKWTTQPWILSDWPSRNLSQPGWALEWERLM
jgi:hypothetical protein